MCIKNRLSDDMKAAMRAKDKDRLGIIRLMQAAIKQREIDSRENLNDSDLVALLSKMIKQRRESEAQYASAGRDDLAVKEVFEAQVIQEYLPEPLTETELDEIIDSTVRDLNAKSMQEMGKVMASLKNKVNGRAEMNSVSQRVKNRLI